MSSEKGLLYASLISHALAEDLGTHGDITSNALFTKNDNGHAIIKSKCAGIVSGIQLIEPIFHHIDSALEIDILVKNGDYLNPETRICTLQGAVRSILAGERVTLNFLQRLSGIATATHNLTNLISHTKARLLDTRKTTPLLRLLEKQAVVHGGGCNHRFGLFDMILIKDTHVKGAGGVSPALTRAKEYVKANNHNVKIEVEIQSVPEFKEALICGADRIMLDNMSLDEIKQCVDLKNADNHTVELEASGNVSEKTIVPLAETGVDFISVGAITHSVAALDIHLILVDKNF